MADRLSILPEETGGPTLAKAILIMNDVILSARKHKLTKSQHVMFLLADMMTWVETGSAICHKGAVYAGGQTRSPSFINAAARLFAREAVEKVYVNGIKITQGCEKRDDEMAEIMKSLDMGEIMRDNLKDMDIISTELVA